MNVLYTSYYGENFGGAEISLSCLATEIEKLGHNVIMASSGQYKLNTKVFRKYAKIPNFKLHERYLVNFLKKIIIDEKIDIVHANDRLTSIPAILAAKQCHIPVIVHFRDYWFACPKSTLLHKNLKNCESCNYKNLLSCSAFWRLPWDAYKLLYLKNACKILQQADVKIAISSSIKKKLAESDISDAKIIPNPVNDMFFEALDARKFKLKNNLNGCIITYAGALEYHKGILQLFGAVSDILKNYDASLLIIGDGPYKQELYRQIKAAQLTSKVHIIKLSHSEMPEAYAASDIVVVPSLWHEPFGRVALEAMASGKPVLVSAVGGLKDTIKDKKYAIPIFDKDEWSARLINLITRPNLRLKIGKVNKAKAKNYLPGKIARAVNELYEKAAHA